MVYTHKKGVSGIPNNPVEQLVVAMQELSGLEKIPEKSKVERGIAKTRKRIESLKAKLKLK